jgi:hypothetical protein
MGLLAALISGLLFGVGPMVSGMANPTKVLGFLDIAGQWDPSLAFVMVSAIAIGSIAFVFAKQRKKSLLGWYQRDVETRTGKRCVRRRLGSCRVMPEARAGRTGRWLSEGVGFCGRDARRHDSVRVNRAREAEPAARLSRRALVLETRAHAAESLTLTAGSARCRGARSMRTGHCRTHLHKVYSKLRSTKDALAMFRKRNAIVPMAA